jgi:hypothetical protein
LISPSFISSCSRLTELPEKVVSQESVAAGRLAAKSSPSGSRWALLVDAIVISVLSSTSANG